MSINPTCNSSFIRPTFVFFLITSLIWIIILLFVFQPYYFNDENYNFNISRRQPAWPAYLELCQYKPRIISNACILYFYRHLSENRIYFALMSVFFQACSSAIVFLILLKWLRLHIIPCFLLGIGLAFIRFNIYTVYELNLGLIEGMAQLFFTLFLYSLCALWDNYSKKNYLVCLFFCTVVTLCHERFIACFIPLIALMILNYYHRKKIPTACSISTFFSLFFILLLPLIFHTNHALSGTGGQPLKFFSVQTKNQFLEIFKNLMGLNKGPDFLVGISEANSPLQLLFSFPETLVIIFGVSIASFSAWKTFKVYGPKSRLLVTKTVRDGIPTYLFSLILIIGLMLPIIGVASMGIRVEMRWLLVPFQCMVIAILYSIKDLEVPNFYAGILGITALVAFISQVPGFKNIYFVGEARSSLALGSILSTGIFDGKSVVITKDSDDVAWIDFIRRFPKVYSAKPSQDLTDPNTVILKIINGSVELQSNVSLLKSLESMTNKGYGINYIEQNLHVNQLLTNPNLKHSDDNKISGWNIDPLGLSAGDKGLDVDSSEMWGWQEVPVRPGETLIIVMGAFSHTTIPRLGRLQINWGKGGKLESSWRKIFTSSQKLSYFCDSVRVPMDIDAASFVLSGQDSGKISIIQTFLYRIENK